jgi:hypothetical protein
MKKIAFLGIMFLIVSSQIFADGNASFIWQLNNYQENAQKINFINLNPMFFNNYYLNISKNVSPNPRNIPNRNVQTISQNENSDVLTTLLLMPLYLFVGTTQPGPELQTRESLELLRRQKETENINRGISPYPSRNIY